MAQAVVHLPLYRDFPGQGCADSFLAGCAYMFGLSVLCQCKKRTGGTSGMAMNHNQIIWELIWDSEISFTKNLDMDDPKAKT